MLCISVDIMCYEAYRNSVLIFASNLGRFCTANIYIRRKTRVKLVSANSSTLLLLSLTEWMIFFKFPLHVTIERRIFLTELNPMSQLV